MKELLSYIFLMGEKVKLRNQLAFFKSFCCVQLVVHIGIRLVVLELVHALNPNRLLCFICREFHRFFHGTLVVYMFLLDGVVHL